MNRISWICLSGFIGLIVIAGLLAPQRSATQIDSTPSLQSSVQSSEMQALVAGNTQFAFCLYQILRQSNRNLFFSPYSISLALGMVYAGAQGTTAEQMESVLHFPVTADRLPLVFGALNAEVAAQGSNSAINQGEAFQLQLANSLWAQRGFAFQQTFLDTLKAQFDAPLRLVNFADTPGISRWMINWWASRQTNGKITELLPGGAITPLTRLMLANAVTFSATWKHQFDRVCTHDEPFHLLNGSRVIVPMMEQITPFAYAALSDAQAIELPYLGDQFSMVVLLPAPGQFEAFAASLTATRVASILTELGRQPVQIYMPRFQFGSSFELASDLQALGMRAAFVLGSADFTRMVDTRELFLNEVRHRTLVSVNEIGTFAAVATSPGLVGPDVPTIRLDRPFIFLIRDAKTNTVLFIGEVLNPSAT